MFEKITRKDKRTNLEKEIDNVLKIMNGLAPDTEEYTKIADNLEKMHKAKSYDNNRHVSPDMIAAIAGNLLGLVIIMNYEKANVITSKALGFVIRGRV